MAGQPGSPSDPRASAALSFVIVHSTAIASARSAFAFLRTASRSRPPGIARSCRAAPIAEIRRCTMNSLALLFLVGQGGAQDILGGSGLRAGGDRVGVRSVQVAQPDAVVGDLVCCLLQVPRGFVQVDAATGRFRDRHDCRAALANPRHAGELTGVSRQEPIWCRSRQWR